MSLSEHWILIMSQAKNAADEALWLATVRLVVLIMFVNEDA